MNFKENTLTVEKLSTLKLRKFSRRKTADMEIDPKSVVQPIQKNIKPVITSKLFYYVTILSKQLPNFSRGFNFNLINPIFLTIKNKNVYQL